MGGGYQAIGIYVGIDGAQSLMVAGSTNGSLHAGLGSKLTTKLTPHLNKRQLAGGQQADNQLTASRPAPVC